MPRTKARNQSLESSSSKKNRVRTPVSSAETTEGKLDLEFYTYMTWGKFLKIWPKVLNLT